MVLLQSEQIVAIILNPWPFIGLWWLGGMLTIFVPRANWNKDKDVYYQAYGRDVEYQRSQRAAQGGYYNNQQTMLNCGWWQFQCRKNEYALQQQMYGGNNNGGDGDNNNEMFRTPGWYQILAGINEEENREARQAKGIDPDSAHGPVRFVYAWSIILFLALLVVGTAVIYKKKNITFVVFCLVVMIQYAFFMLLLLPQGVISTDDRDLEDTVYGWFGQLSVLMVYFYYAQMWFGAISLGIFGAWSYLLNKLLGGAVAAAAAAKAAEGEAEASCNHEPILDMVKESVAETAGKIKKSTGKVTKDVGKIVSALNREPVFEEGETTAGYSEASKLNIA